MTLAVPIAAPLSISTIKRRTLMGCLAPPAVVLEWADIVQSSRLSAAVYARHAVGNGGEDFAGDGAGPFRELVGGDFLFSLSTDKHGLVARFGIFNTGHIREHLVDPASPPDSPQPAAADELVEIVHAYLT